MIIVNSRQLTGRALGPIKGDNMMESIQKRKGLNVKFVKNIVYQEENWKTTSNLTKLESVTFVDITLGILGPILPEVECARNMQNW